MHIAIGLCCCRYLVIIPVQPNDGSVNMLFDCCIIVFGDHILGRLQNEGSKVHGGPIIRSTFSSDRRLFDHDTGNSLFKKNIGKAVNSIQVIYTLHKTSCLDQSLTSLLSKQFFSGTFFEITRTRSICNCLAIKLTTIQLIFYSRYFVILNQL